VHFAPPILFMVQRGAVHQSYKYKTYQIEWSIFCHSLLWVSVTTERISGSILSSVSGPEDWLPRPDWLQTQGPLISTLALYHPSPISSL